MPIEEKNYLERIFQDIYNPFFENNLVSFTSFIEKQHPSHFISILNVTYQKILKRTQIEIEEKRIQDEWKQLESELENNIKKNIDLNHEKSSNKQSIFQINSESNPSLKIIKQSKMNEKKKAKKNKKCITHVFNETEMIENTFRMRLSKISSETHSSSTKNSELVSRYIFETLLVSDIYESLSIVDYNHENDLVGTMKMIFDSTIDFPKFFDLALEKQISIQQIRFLFTKRRESLMYFFGIIFTSFQSIVLGKYVSFKPYQCQFCKNVFCWDKKPLHCIKCKSVIYCSDNCLKNHRDSHKMQCIELAFRKASIQRNLKANEPNKSEQEKLQLSFNKSTNFLKGKDNKNNNKKSIENESQNRKNKFYEEMNFNKLFHTEFIKSKYFWLTLFILIIIVLISISYHYLFSQTRSPYFQSGSFKWWKNLLFQRILPGKILFKIF